MLAPVRSFDDGTLMPKRFKAIWGDKTPARSEARPAASADADAESGTAGDNEAEDRRKALFALKAMRDRGLMSAAEYERRRAALEGEG